MRIYIPTRGRRLKQIFFDALPPNLQACCVFVCNDQESIPPALGKCAGSQITPVWVKNIGDKRHYICHELHDGAKHGPQIIMCDDDLRLNARRKDDPTKFRPMQPEDYELLFLAIHSALDEHAHVTVMPREGGNRVSVDQECTRAMRILGYDQNVLREETVSFQRVPTKEDFDATLQLLRAGHKNLMLADWVQDDGGGSNARGGCSIYRDDAYMKARAEDLARLHPGFVKVVQKETKGAWGGGVRTDVSVQWKQAYKSSQP